MPIYVTRRPQRKALFLPMEGRPDKPALLFIIPETVSKGQLDELIRKQLELQGVTGESEAQTVVNKAEMAYERNVKIGEAKKETRRLMQIRANGGKLMQRGFRKWSQAFYGAVDQRRKNTP